MKFPSHYNLYCNLAREQDNLDSLTQCLKHDTIPTMHIEMVFGSSE